MAEPTTQEILTAVRAYHKGRGPLPDEALVKKYSKKTVLAKIQQMCNAGVLEYDEDIRAARVVGEENG